MTRWRAEYDDGTWRFYRDRIELETPTEAAVFRELGMAFISPEQRSL